LRDISFWQRMGERADGVEDYDMTRSVVMKQMLKEVRC
jgi:hypothetical protein